jgi:phosphatidate cytidylyltransferase
MRRVLTAVILIPLVLLALFKAPFQLYTVILMLVAVVCANEYLDIVQAHQLKPLHFLTYVSILAVLGDYYLSVAIRALHPTQVTGWQVVADPVHQYEFLLVFVTALPFIMLACAMRTDELRAALPSAAASYVAVPYIGISIGFLLFSRALIPDGAIGIFDLLLIVWAGDIAAYYVGRAIGKNKLAPRVSPGKTWEGAIASFVASGVVGSLLLIYNSQLATTLYNWKLLLPASALSEGPHPAPNSIAMAVAASLCINVAAQIGDLVESMMKRGADIKDSGTLLPGHGGVLDRIDALLFASPVLWYFASFRLINF